ncbi:MAG TPA: tetratricopeptide repeat protein [Thermoanaerobaculia bacterium]|nr:tetratricopeptide repeat protein [Thermoanaerobaculia bacterium]
MKRRALLIVAGVVLLLVAGGAAALLLGARRDVTTSSSAAYEAYKEGVANESRFYFKEARVAYARALELDPNFAMAMLGMARQANDEGQRLAFLRRATREEPRLTDRERLEVEMQLAFSTQTYEKGLQIARDLHAKYPDDVRSASLLAREEIRKGNTDKAIRIFEELLAVDPNNAEAYNQVGYFYGYRGDYEKAMEYLKKYQFIAVDNANPFDSLGEVQAYSGHYNEAIENLTRALTIKPDFVESHGHLAVAYEGLGDWAKAVAQYEKAAAQTDSPDMKRGMLMAAFKVSYCSHDTESARRLAAEVRALPKTKYSELDLAALDAAMFLIDHKPLEAEKRIEAVKPDLQKIVAGEKLPDGWKPHFPGFNMIMAIAKEQQGLTDEALAYWQKNANPPNPFNKFEDRRMIYEARAHVAVALAKKGDLDAAEKLIAENRKWNPSWAPVREYETAVAEMRREKVLAAAK